MNGNNFEAITPDCQIVTKDLNALSDTEKTLIGNTKSQLESINSPNSQVSNGQLRYGSSKYSLDGTVSFSNSGNINHSSFVTSEYSLTLVDKTHFTLANPGDLARLFVNVDVVTFVYKDGTVKMKPFEITCLKPDEQQLLQNSRLVLRQAGQQVEKNMQTLDKNMQNTQQNMEKNIQNMQQNSQQSTRNMEQNVQNMERNLQRNIENMQNQIRNIERNTQQRNEIKQQNIQNIRQNMQRMQQNMQQSIDNVRQNMKNTERNMQQNIKITQQNMETSLQNMQQSKRNMQKLQQNLETLDQTIGNKLGESSLPKLD